MAVFTGLGSQATPSITFSADTDTGVFSPGANQVAITTGGTARLNVASTGEVTTANQRLNLINVSSGVGVTTGSVAVGCSVLISNTTGCFNSAFGANALCSNTTGDFNSASGGNALASNTTGCFNSAFGTNALRDNTTGFNNTASGVSALCLNTTGCANTASGAYALLCNTTGGANTAVGGGALLCNTTGSCNVATGANALYYNTTANCNVATGANALYINTTGCANTASGAYALHCNTTGCDNTAMGGGALLCNTTGSSNVATGANALFSNTTGCNNIGIGVNAGTTIATPAGLVDLTTQPNRIVMGNFDHTCAQIKIAWTATSDCRDKTCFAPVPHGLDFVRALKPTEYRFKEGGRDSEIAEEKRRYGFLAQDILPLEGEEPVIISADDPDKLQYTEAHLIPVLVKAIQELAQEVNELKNA